MTSDEADGVGFGGDHGGEGGAVDVGVEDADGVVEGAEGEGQVDGGGGFADSAFAGGDGDDGGYLAHAVGDLDLGSRGGWVGILWGLRVCWVGGGG